MKTYLVGGAVRDKLLGLEVKEFDWVVVGANYQQMLDLGYSPVGRDFPVFLHPTTKEEYALARQERKTSKGYHGFECNYNSKVSLEEDLLRRDLTINAMAMDADGNIIDPFGGRKDLTERVLRHVSSAFIEDPLRLLRLARFAARFYFLGFKLAAETKNLLREIVQSGELEFLVPERVWQELRKSLLTQNPEIFFCILRECGALQHLFPEIDKLFGVPATNYYHPEIDTGVHSLMVIKRAADLSDKLSVRLAAVLHDLGKGVVAKMTWPSHTNHEELGCEVIKNFCLKYNIPTQLRRFAILVSKLHLQIHKVLELNAEDIVDTLEKADAFRNQQLFLDLILVAKADYLGRGFGNCYPDLPWFFPNYPDKIDCYQQEQVWFRILENCLKINISEFIDDDYSGEEIKKKLRQKRLECVENIIKFWKLHEK